MVRCIERRDLVASKRPAASLASRWFCLARHGLPCPGEGTGRFRIRCDLQGGSFQYFELCYSVWRASKPRKSKQLHRRRRPRPSQPRHNQPWFPKCRRSPGAPGPVNACAAMHLGRARARQASEGRAGQIPRRGVWTIAGHRPLHSAGCCPFMLCACRNSGKATKAIVGLMCPKMRGGEDQHKTSIRLS